MIGDFNAKEDKLDLSALGLTDQNFDKLFSVNETANADKPLAWNSETQTLNYYTGSESVVLAQFLNPTELTAANFIA